MERKRTKWMTADSSRFPEHVEIKQGDLCHLNTSPTWSRHMPPHGFLIPMYMFNLRSNRAKP
ncbi:MAG: hypothetical protein IPJ94_29690 [Chloroflexi bacterium]|nr:hypothetical protein [Chloroflexota bacterium]